MALNSTGGQKSDSVSQGYPQSILRAAPPSGRSREEAVSLPFAASRGTHTACLDAPSIFKASSGCQTLSVSHPLTQVSYVWFPHLRTLVITLSSSG